MLRFMSNRLATSSGFMRLSEWTLTPLVQTQILVPQPFAFPKYFRDSAVDPFDRLDAAAGISRFSSDIPDRQSEDFWARKMRWPFCRVG